MQTIIYCKIRPSYGALHSSSSSALHSACLNGRQTACYSHLYLLYQQTMTIHTFLHTHTPTHTHFFPPPTHSLSPQIWFSITEGGLGAADDRMLFCHWHPTVILWFITPALRLNWVTSIPGSMELAAWTSRHRSPSHVAPREKDKGAASPALQTSGDNISQKKKKLKSTEIIM